jgi:Fe-S cluster assembly iron-binding protein IscA
MENTDNIIMTPEAAIAIKSLMKEQNLEEKSLRVFIAGVG